MSYNYTIKYRPFEQLMADVKVDFQNYDLEHFIEPAQLIKVAKRVNYDLGLRIAQTKEYILDVEKGRVKLPDNFYVLNFALICEYQEDHVVFPQGTHIEERKIIAPYKETNAHISACDDGTVNCQRCYQPIVNSSCGCATPAIPTACSAGPYNPLVPFGDNCIKPRRVFMNCKGDEYEIVQVVNSTQTNTYKRLIPIRILENPETIDCDCPNLYLTTRASAWIQNGFLFTTFPHAKVYINYQGMMEDDDGNLLVPDHDLLNEYYEYAIKQRIIENLIMNDEVVNQAKVQLIETRFRAARNNALSLVNTPNFSEMKRVWEMNRKAQYAKYYDMFKSYPWYQWDKNPNDVMGEKIMR